jgi:hypothetical protein
MKFLRSLKNRELLRNLRVLRNVEDAAQLRPAADQPISDYVSSVLQALTRAPQLICSLVSQDFDCRPAHGPAYGIDTDFKWNVFIHLKIKIVNLGVEGTRITGAGLDVPGIDGSLVPHVYANEGGAFSYNKSDHYKLDCPPQSEQVVPMNFIFPSKIEKKKKFRTTLKIRFENCAEKTIRVRVNPVSLTLGLG